MAPFSFSIWRGVGLVGWVGGCTKVDVFFFFGGGVFKGSETFCGYASQLTGGCQWML